MVKIGATGVARYYNIAPTQLAPVIYQGGVVEQMRWGLIPFSAKDKSIGSRMINARAETVAEKQAFRRALRSQRCLVPASGFFEWKQTDDGKVPYYFHRRDDGMTSCSRSLGSMTAGKILRMARKC